METGRGGWRSPPPREGERGGGGGRTRDDANIADRLGCRETRRRKVGRTAHLLLLRQDTTDFPADGRIARDGVGEGEEQPDGISFGVLPRGLASESEAGNWFSWDDS